jgi:hypothetical protein
MTTITDTTTTCPSWCDDHIDYDVDPGDSPCGHHRSQPTRWGDGSNRLRLMRATDDDPAGTFVSFEEWGTELTPDQARALVAELVRLADVAEGR